MINQSADRSVGRNVHSTCGR